MTARAARATLKDIEPLRALFLQATNFQIRLGDAAARLCNLGLPLEKPLNYV